jgi:competence protein ComEA
MRKCLALMLGFLAAAPVLAGPVDINSADAATLARELDGIGLARAKAIVEYRDRNGRFRSVDEVLNVKGIGPQVLEQNKGNLMVKEAGK